MCVISRIMKFSYCLSIIDGDHITVGEMSIFVVWISVTVLFLLITEAIYIGYPGNYLRYQDCLVGCRLRYCDYLYYSWKKKIKLVITMALPRLCLYMYQTDLLIVFLHKSYQAIWIFVKLRQYGRIVILKAPST